MNYYQLGQRAAFHKLGMSPVLSHALVGGALGAGAGYGFSDDNHKLRGTLVGGALGATLGGVAGDYRGPMTDSIPETRARLNAAGAQAEGRVVSKEMIPAEVAAVKGRSDAETAAYLANRGTHTIEEINPLIMNHHKFVESHMGPGGNPNIADSWKKVVSTLGDNPDQFPSAMEEHRRYLTDIQDGPVHDNFNLLNSKNLPKG